MHRLFEYAPTSSRFYSTCSYMGIRNMFMLEGFFILIYSLVLVCDSAFCFSLSFLLIFDHVLSIGHLGFWSILQFVSWPRSSL